MAIERKFKVGDKVKLKSGGPDMTVQNVYDDPKNPFLKEYGGLVKCTWFNDKNIRLTDDFNQDTLDKV